MELWTTAYRPKTLDAYVWRDVEMRKTIESWLAQKALPHCLFSGASGTGKTSLALLLLDLLQIPHEDILKINASRERKVDELQDKIINFIDAWAFGPTGFKYILLDESDKLSQYSQGMLRAEIQTYDHTCRFIMTCNYPAKIIPALHSRLQEIKFSTLDETEFAMRAANVLIHEEVRYEPEVLLDYIGRTYPDLRKCLGTLQQNSRDGMLQPPAEEVEGTKDYLLHVVELFKTGHYLEARKLIINQADPEEYVELFRFFYEHLEMFGNSTQQEKALLSIRDAILNHPIVADQEINLSALIVELTMIAKSE